MRRVGKLLAGAAVLVAATGSAFAADVVVIPPPAPPPPPAIAAVNLFEGPYWGAYGGIWNGAVQQRLTPIAGTQFGYNLAFGSFMTGFEVETEYLWIRSTVEATLSGRLGVIIGTHILLYGQIGIGTFYGSIPHWSAGAGFEVALGTSRSLFVEAKRLWRLGGPNILAWTVRGGLNYYADPSNTGPGGDFDWAGLYFGAHLGRATGNIMPAAGPWLGGVQVGYNFGGGGFVVGPEVETSYTFGNNAWINAAANARAGAALGPLLVYGEVGIGTYNWIPVWTAGGGVELALGDMFGLFAEGKAMFRLGAGGGVDGTQINGGVNIHFGR